MLTFLDGTTGSVLPEGAAGSAEACDGGLTQAPSSGLSEEELTAGRVFCVRTDEGAVAALQVVEIRDNRALVTRVSLWERV